VPANDVGVPFGSLEEALRANPSEPGTRKRLRATALNTPADVHLRYAALHALEQAPPQSDTLAVAVAIAGLPGSDDGQRWLVANAIAVLTRLNTPDARAALASLQASPSFKADAANVLAANGKGH
jgi:hypothetical protein